MSAGMKRVAGPVGSFTSSTVRSVQPEAANSSTAAAPSPLAPPVSTTFLPA